MGGNFRTDVGRGGKRGGVGEEKKTRKEKKKAPFVSGSDVILSSEGFG